MGGVYQHGREREHSDIGEGFTLGMDDAGQEYEVSSNRDAEDTITSQHALGRLMSFQEAITRLGIAPHTFRQIYTQFRDLIEPNTGGPVIGVTEKSLTLLAQILKWRNEGHPPEEVRQLLVTGTASGEQKTASPEPAALSRYTGQAPAEMEIAAASAGSVAPLSPDQLQALQEKLQELNTKLAKSEERRTEDRDRLVTLIMRTQMEIQHLRYELAASQSRRDRHRGFWRRLFGG